MKCNTLDVGAMYKIVDCKFCGVILRILGAKVNSFLTRMSKMSKYRLVEK